MELLPSVDGVQPFVATEEGKLVQGTLQDCTPIREYALELHKTEQHGSSDMKLAAKLPLVAVETYCNTTGIDLAEFMKNPVHIKRMCNDPALKDFRIWPGRV